MVSGYGVSMRVAMKTFHAARTKRTPNTIGSMGGIWPLLVI